jgi:hypothetical protein
MNSKLLFALVFTLFVFLTGCGRSSSLRQREAELAELKISNSNLVAQLQQAKLQSDKDKTNQESELTELKTEMAGLNEQLQQTKKQAEDEKTQQETERQNTLRQQEAQESSSKKKDAAQKAFKELLKLKSITGTGVSYSQYSDRLVDSKTTIEMALLDVDDSNFKSAVSDILATYIDARDYWSLCIQSSSYPMIRDSDLMTRINNEYGKYKIPYEGPEGPAFAGKSIFLTPSQASYIWDFANKQIDDLTKTFPDLLK